MDIDKKADETAQAIFSLLGKPSELRQLRERVAVLEEALDRIARFDECFVEAYNGIEWNRKQSHAGVAVAEALAKYARKALGDSHD